VINHAAMLLLDVRDLEPPEPLTAILRALEAMPAKQALKVRHRREPFPLYPLLDDMGYEYRCWMSALDDYRLYIWKSGQHKLKTLCAEDISSERSL
jgi:hypothetical protein